MRKLIGKTVVKQPTKFQIGESVSWDGIRGTVEGVIGAHKYVVHVAGYVVEVWESELTMVGDRTATIE